MNKKIVFLILILSIIYTNNHVEAKKNATVTSIKKKVKMFAGDKCSLKIKKGKYKIIKWKSCNTSIATVNKKGVVKAKKRGRVKIVCKTDKFKVTYVVTVKNKKKNNNHKLNETVIETQFPHIITPTPLPTMTLTPMPTDNSGIQKPSPTSSTQKKSLVVQGTRLEFVIDQKEVFSDTKVLSGKLSETTISSIVRVYVGGKLSDNRMKIEGGMEIGNTWCPIGVEDFFVNVDFSNVENGSIINIIREPNPYIEPSIVNETDTLIVKEGIWSINKQYTINEKANEEFPDISDDIWLLFGIMDEIITIDTKEIVCEYAMDTFPVCLEVNVPGKYNSKKEIFTETNIIPIDVDFSNCEVGDIIEISLKYIGDEESKGGATIWNQTHKYTIMQEN